MDYFKAMKDITRKHVNGGVKMKAYYLFLEYDGKYSIEWGDPDEVGSCEPDAGPFYLYTEAVDYVEMLEAQGLLNVEMDIDESV